MDGSRVGRDFRVLRFDGLIGIFFLVGIKGFCVYGYEYRVGGIDVMRMV